MPTDRDEARWAKMLELGTGKFCADNQEVLDRLEVEDCAELLRLLYAKHLPQFVIFGSYGDGCLEGGIGFADRHADYDVDDAISDVLHDAKQVVVFDLDTGKEFPLTSPQRPTVIWGEEA